MQKVLTIFLWILIACFVVSVCFTPVVYKKLEQDATQHFSHLAQSFLHGHLYFSEILLIGHDSTFFNGEYYWPQGPFPALVLLPYVALLAPFHYLPSQLIPNMLLTLVVYLLVYLLAQKIGYKKRDSHFLAIAFCLGSGFLMTYLNVSGGYFAHVITVTLLFLGLLEYSHKRRWWLIGLIMGCVIATRLPAGLGIFFFILEIFRSPETRKEKLINLRKFFIPIIIILILLGFYNYARFGSFLDQGYSRQIIINEPAVIQARHYGLMNFVHIPGNLFYMFLQSPIPVYKDGVSHVLTFPYISSDMWGMSIFINSPFLLTLFYISYKRKTFQNLLITSFIIMIPILLFYGIGYRQINYRYALDFLPFLFYLFMLGYKEMSSELSYRMQWAIIFTSLFNIYLWITVTYLRE
jgi:hypothetical protein